MARASSAPADRTTTRATEHRRLGPRPLPLHLTAASLAWTSSRAALPFLRNGSLPWRPEVRDAAAALRERLANVDPEAFARAVDRQIERRLRALAEGILAYRRHPYRRTLPVPPTLWREGTTRLLDYGATERAGAARAKAGRRPGPPVLVVPSLINRAYILDLTAETSLLRWLAGQGLRPLLVDWDRPGPEERGFTLTDYIAGRLETALDAVRETTAAPPLLIGYCMGGLLALGLALRRRHHLCGLALLATPWDFHAESGLQGALAASALAALGPLIDTLGELPVDPIQALFAGLDPQLVARKFVAFARLDPTSPKAASFVALEDWLNDGVPLAAPVARECLSGWYADNTPATGRWRVAGRPVDPARLDLPCLSVIPAQDRIVPPASAAALAAAIPGAQRMVPPMGHIGMVVGGRARQQVWRPLLAWLRARAAGAP
ncbi:MAG: alpha/beta fold hydrolase [Kiloniellaceae bacterium]